MKLKAIIVEDEANSREIMQGYLAKYCKDVELLGMAANVKGGLELIKKNNPDELVKAVDFVQEIKEREKALAGKVLQSNIKGAGGKITLPQQDGFQVLDVADIYFCKADDNYTEIYLENKKILISKTLKYFEEALSEFPFARIHKSYLVNTHDNSSR